MSRADPISDAGTGEVLDSLIDGKKLEDMTVGIAEIDPAPSTAVICLHIVQGTRSAPVWNPFIPDATENLIEFLVSDFKSVVMRSEI